MFANLHLNLHFLHSRILTQDQQRQYWEWYNESMKIGCIFLIQYEGIMIGGISLDKELQSVRICLKEPGLESGFP